jgi:hypothetical protein
MNGDEATGGSGMTTAILVDQTTERQSIDAQHELVLVSIVSVFIVATGILVNGATTGLLSAAVLVSGSTLLRLAGTPLGMKRASVVGAAHLAAVVLLALTATV